MKNSKKMPKKYIKVLSNIFLWTSHTDPWSNMLQTLERRRKYIGVILSDEHTHKSHGNSWGISSWNRMASECESFLTLCKNSKISHEEGKNLDSKILLFLAISFNGKTVRK